VSNFFNVKDRTHIAFSSADLPNRRRIAKKGQRLSLKNSQFSVLIYKNGAKFRRDQQKTNPQFEQKELFPSLQQKN
jgi:hypothetical protein